MWWLVVVAAVAVVLVVLGTMMMRPSSSYVPMHLQVPPSDTRSMVWMKGVRKSNWQLTSDGAQVLSDLRLLRQLAGRPFDVVDFPQFEPDLGMHVPGTSFTLAEFCVEMEKACGGRVVPNLNLDYYTNQGGLYDVNGAPTGMKALQAYNDAYRKVSPFKDAPHPLYLEAYPTFNRPTAPGLQVVPQDREGIIRSILSTGWTHGLVDSGGRHVFPSYGLPLQYLVWPTIDPNTGAVSVDAAQVSKARATAPNFPVLVYMNLQAFPPPGSVFDIFMTLSPTQQLQALKTLASGQAKGGYRFVYTIGERSTMQGRQGQVWEAARQPVGATTFLHEIGALMREFG